MSSAGSVEVAGIMRVDYRVASAAAWMPAKLFRPHRRTEGRTVVDSPRHSDVIVATYSAM